MDKGLEMSMDGDEAKRTRTSTKVAPVPSVSGGCW